MRTVFQFLVKATAVESGERRDLLVYVPAETEEDARGKVLPVSGFHDATVIKFSRVHPRGIFVMTPSMRERLRNGGNIAMVFPLKKRWFARLAEYVRRLM